MVRLNIQLSNAHGQCYDGAKNMHDIKNDVSDKILSENPKAFFTHCFGHAVGCWRCGEECTVLIDSMYTTYGTSNLVKKSPKRDAMLQKTWKDTKLEYPGFRVLCPRRWTVRAESMKSILDN